MILCVEGFHGKPEPASWFSQSSSQKRKRKKVLLCVSAKTAFPSFAAVGDTNTQKEFVLQKAEAFGRQRRCLCREELLSKRLQTSAHWRGDGQKLLELWQTGFPAEEVEICCLRL